MKKWIVTAILAGFFLEAATQTAPGTYWVQFTDKTGTPFSLDQPLEFLSQRALDRRQRFDIPIVEQDLPVMPVYVDSLRQLGLQILATSRWFNAVTVYSMDQELIDTLGQLTFVRQVKSMKQPSINRSLENKFNIETTVDIGNDTESDTTLLDYGQGSWQIGMLNGHILHNQGYQGQDMVIAVLDAGFYNAHTNPAFDSLWKNNQILGTWDFVTRSPVQFNQHRHGSQVLSVMGSNMPGRLVGSAPKASFYLLRTEDANVEFLVEEDYWVAAAEFADSAGADLINSSLGYSRFDSTYMDHTYADMDGNTTRISIGADIAASKGILVVTSASNEGATDWHFITAPADADSVLTVGAVDSLGFYASFSSTGPTFDGRVKPNIAAQGQQTAISATDGTVIRGNGTSFSSPLMCGLAACLWQTNRSVSPAELIHIIEQSASQATRPDSLLGYGIPDLGKALFMIQGIDPFDVVNEKLLRTYPNPFDESLTIDFYSPKHQEVIIVIYSLYGQILFRRNVEVGLTSFNHIVLYPPALPNEGIFLLQMITREKKHSLRIMRVKQ